MQKVKLLLPLALFLGLFFTACHEDDPLDHDNLVKVAFVGRVIDENGDAIPGAVVSAGTESSQTDAQGVFRLPAVKLPAAHAMVSVKKSGYYNLSRPYIVEKGSTQTVTLQLLKKNQIDLINAITGGPINVPGGPVLTFPANAITDEFGGAFNGYFRVFARYLDPSDPMLALFVPGDMTAENAADEVVFLATYGMVAVEIENQFGQKLKIAPGKEVELRMPIIASQLASSPASIPLWYYDEITGHWKEEGSAQKVGNEYVGKVSHFSFWNCDAQFPLTQLHGQIFLEKNTQPLVNACVRITMLSTNASSFGYTDVNGFFGGCIPKDEPLQLEVILPENCGGQVLFTQNIGPFADISTIPPIFIPASAQVPLFKLSGRLVTCTGQPITNGYVKVAFASETEHYFFADEDGSFDFVAVGCDNAPKTGMLTGYDLTNLLESNAISINTPPNTIDLGNLMVCNAVTEYIQYTLDGQSFTNIDPFGALNTTTTILATQQDSLLNLSLHMTFQNSGQLGKFPVISLNVNQFDLYPLSGNTVTTTVTAYGNKGDNITGTFDGNFKDINGGNHKISGSYRVLREW